MSYNNFGSANTILKFNDDMCKKIFHDVNSEDISEITSMINLKINEIKCSKEYMFNYDASANVLVDGIAKYIRELKIEYGEIGIRDKYKKIEKILHLLKLEKDRKEDIEIVKAIHEEYLISKKIAKSNMLYLNKIFREINNTIEKDTTAEIERS